MTTTKADTDQSATALSAGGQLRERVKTQPPVFIFEVMQGDSSFLADLLLNHPSLQASAILEEDYVMEHAHLLLQYVDKTCARWKGLPWIEKPEDWRSELLCHLSDGILELLMSQIGADRRLLAKTTAARNVDKFFQFFPEAKLLILIKDGRDAVESAARKEADKPYEFWMQQWVEGARSILNFMRVSGDMRGKSWELVRYEDLVERPAAIVADLLSFLQLDSAEVTGRPLEKSADFNPPGGWRQWGWFRKRAFKRIAGQELISFGYASNDRW